MSIYQKQNHFISITAFYALTLFEYNMLPHTHNSCEIMYVDQGKCTILTENPVCTEDAFVPGLSGSGENGSTYTLTKGQFIFLDEGISHRLVISEGQPCSILNLEFGCLSQKTPLDLSEPMQNSTYAADFMKKQAPVLVGTDNFRLGFALKDLISQLQSKQPDQDYLIRLLFHRAFLELTHNISIRRKQTGTQYLKKACTYLEEHLTEAVSIPELADHTGINKSYLQALFSRHLGCTITEYRNRCRLSQAVYLLTNSSLSITDIAFHTGFNSRQHFGSTFEKYYQLSPKAYRQLHGRPAAPSTQNSQYLLRQDGGWDQTPLTKQ